MNFVSIVTETLIVLIINKISLLTIIATAILEEVIGALKKKNLLENYIRWIITPRINTLDLTIKCLDRKEKKSKDEQMLQHLKHASITCPVIGPNNYVDV